MIWNSLVRPLEPFVLLAEQEVKPYNTDSQIPEPNPKIQVVSPITRLYRFCLFYSIISFHSISIFLFYIHIPSIPIILFYYFETTAQRWYAVVADIFSWRFHWLSQDSVDSVPNYALIYSTRVVVCLFPIYTLLGLNIELSISNQWMLMIQNASLVSSVHLRPQRKSGTAYGFTSQKHPIQTSKWQYPRHLFHTWPRHLII